MRARLVSTPRADSACHSRAVLRLVGLYDHEAAYGEELGPVGSMRVISPDGSSLRLKDGRPGTDHDRTAGFNAQVNQHRVGVVGNAVPLSGFSAVVQLRRIRSGTGRPAAARPGTPNSSADGRDGIGAARGIARNRPGRCTEMPSGPQS
jgi:type IV secretory pathway VirB10-like protein